MTSRDEAVHRWRLLVSRRPIGFYITHMHYEWSNIALFSMMAFLLVADAARGVALRFRNVEFFIHAIAAQRFCSHSLRIVCVQHLALAPSLSFHLRPLPPSTLPPEDSFLSLYFPWASANCVIAIAPRCYRGDRSGAIFFFALDASFTTYWMSYTEEEIAPPHVLSRYCLKVSTVLHDIVYNVQLRLWVFIFFLSWNICQGLRWEPVLVSVRLVSRVDLSAIFPSLFYFSRRSWRIAKLLEKSGVYFRQPVCFFRCRCVVPPDKWFVLPVQFLFNLMRLQEDGSLKKNICSSSDQHIPPPQPPMHK